MELYFTNPIHLHTERGDFDRAVLGTYSSSDGRILSGFPFPEDKGTEYRSELDPKPSPPPHHSTRFRLRFYSVVKQNWHLRVMFINTFILQSSL